MRKHSRILVVFVVSLIVGLSSSAHAHNVADYPAYGWKYTILSRVFYQSPSGWPNTYNARTTDAMQSWNNVSSMSLTRSLAGNAPSDTWMCGASFDFLKTATALAHNVVARTTACPTTNSTVRIQLNTADYDFYNGSVTPNPAGTQDLQGNMTHELGHGLQAWGFCTDGSPQDPCAGAEYDPIFNFAICNPSDMPSFSTMCIGGIDDFKTWRLRSLETHDTDLPQAMY